MPELNPTGATSLATDGGTVNIASVTAKTYIKSALNVDHEVTLDSKLDVSGATTLKDNVSIDNGKTLTVGNGATALGGTLKVTGETTMNDDVSIVASKKLNVDTITEKTSDSGVTIDSVVLKKGGITTTSNATIGANLNLSLIHI